MNERPPEHRSPILIDTVFLDVDGVLVDFRGAALKLFDSSIGCDDSPEYSMGKILGIPGTEFWERVDAEGPEFWRTLPKFPWCDDLIDHLRVLSRRLFFVTSPSWNVASVTGKMLWFQDQFGKDFNDFIFTRRKELFARYPDSVLIDDSKANVDEFNAAGGWAILFPQVWNGNVRPEDPVKYVVQHLESLNRAR